MLTTLLMLAALAAPTENNPTMADTYTLMTYNIHHGEGTDGKVDLQRIADIILGVDPDFVCLQEVDKNLPRTSHRDFPAELSVLLNMPVIFEANYRFDGGEYGNATLSRLPMVRHKNLSLPGPENAEPRGCLGVTVDAGGKELTVWNTHWGLQAGERESQGNFLATALEEGPAILTGDFNEDAGGKGLQALSPRFHSAMPLLKEGAPKFSTASRTRLIDHILGSRHVVFLDATILDSPETALASDHFPVVTTFSFE